MAIVVMSGAAAAAPPPVVVNLAADISLPAPQLGEGRDVQVDVAPPASNAIGLRTKSGAAVRLSPHVADQLRATIFEGLLAANFAPIDDASGSPPPRGGSRLRLRMGQIGLAGAGNLRAVIEAEAFNTKGTPLRRRYIGMTKVSGAIMPAADGNLADLDRAVSKAVDAMLRDRMFLLHLAR